jgi:hypothetical protein
VGSYTSGMHANRHIFHVPPRHSLLAACPQFLFQAPPLQKKEETQTRSSHRLSRTEINVSLKLTVASLGLPAPHARHVRRRRRASHKARLPPNGVPLVQQSRDSPYTLHSVAHSRKAQTSAVSQPRLAHTPGHCKGIQVNRCCLHIIWTVFGVPAASQRELPKLDPELHNTLYM